MYREVMLRGQREAIAGLCSVREQTDRLYKYASGCGEGVDDGEGRCQAEEARVVAEGGAGARRRGGNQLAL
jgi:hypothetical protein